MLTRHTRSAFAAKRGALRNIVSSLWLVLALCALGLSGYQVTSGQWHATPVLSGSMRPGLQPGDVVVTQRVPVSDLRVRDVVVFHPPNEGQLQVVHRIVKITVRGGTTSITTWGDANAVPDPAASSLRGTTAYRMVRVVPLVGYPAVWLQNGNRGTMVIGIGVILLIAAMFTLLRPDKPAKPSGSADPDEPVDSANIASEPLETATR